MTNIFGIVVDSGNNVGFIRSHPVAPAPAEAFALWTETYLPFAPLTLVVDAGNPVPFNAWPDPAANLGVTELAGSNGLWLPLVDGVGLFGPPDGAACEGHGNFILSGFAMPDPPAGVNFTLQAVYLDPAATLGFDLTFPLHTFGL